MNISRFEKVCVNLKSIEWSSHGRNSFASYSDINFMKIVNSPTDTALLTLLLQQILNILYVTSLVSDGVIYRLPWVPEVFSREKGSWVRRSRAAETLRDQTKADTFPRGFTETGNIERKVSDTQGSYRLT